MNDNSERRTYQTESTGNDRVRVRLRVGDKEMEIEGPEEYVNERAGMFLSHLASSDRPKNGSALLSGEKTNISAETQAVTMDVAANQQPLSLINLFQEKSPSNQRDEVLLITHFYQKYIGKETLSIEDYIEAFTTLKRLAVEMPSNMKSSVRNVVDRTKFLYNPERGQFALTLHGEQFIENIGGNNE